VTISAGQAPGLVTMSLETPVRLTSGYYWLGLHSGGSTAVARYAATSVAKALRFNTTADAFADGASSPFGSTSSDDKLMSMSAIGVLG